MVPGCVQVLLSGPTRRPEENSVTVLPLTTLALFICLPSRSPRGLDTLLRVGFCVTRVPAGTSGVRKGFRKVVAPPGLGGD